MRLFIGLPFPHQARRDFLLVERQLQRNAVKGIFPSVGNFHLTLAFLGEREERSLPTIFAALEQADIPPLDLTFDRLGCFDSGIWYLSPAPCAPLTEGQARLAAALGLESRLFVPHLTLGRKVVLRDGYIPPKVLDRPIPAHSEGPRLFLSHRVEGELCYDILSP